MNRFQRAYKELFGSFGNDVEFPSSQAPLSLQQTLYDSPYIRTRTFEMTNGVQFFLLENAESSNISIDDFSWTYWNNGGSGGTNTVNSVAYAIVPSFVTTFDFATAPLQGAFSGSYAIADNSSINFGKGNFYYFTTVTNRFAFWNHKLTIPKGYKLLLRFNTVSTQSATLYVQYLYRRSEWIPEFEF